MKELISIQDRKGQQVVSARELHLFLGVQTNFTNWSKRMFEYGFEQEKDFTPIMAKSTGGRPSKDYALTLDTAKEISMIQRNKKGKEARQYFIEVEKRANQLVKPMSTLDMMEATIKHMRIQEAELNQVKQDIKEIKAKTETKPDYFTIAGYGTLNGYPVNVKTAASLGRKASAFCKREGLPLDTIPDPRFGRVNMYPIQALDFAFENYKVA